MLLKKMAVLPTILIVMGLSACKDSSDSKSAEDHQKDGFDVNSSGRLLVSAAETAEVAVMNLEDGQELERITVSAPASALRSSPQYRFGLVAHREQGSIEIIDGGLYEEDHGDHMHPYEKDPSLSAKTFSGTNPAHYQVHDGQAAIFFDGTDGVVASITVFNDQAILGNKELSLELDNNMHGTAEPSHDYLLTTFREADAGSSLPSQVELHEVRNGQYEFVERFDEACPSLHGSFSTEDATVFGCSDGVLVVSQDDGNFSANKIANPASMAEGVRIGSFSAYAGSHILAGWAGGSLYAVNIDDASITAVDWTHGDDAELASAKMDDEGNVLAVLDKTGTIHLLDAKNNFERLNKVKIIETMPELSGHAKVTMIPAPGSEEMFIVDSVDQKIIVLDVEEAKLKSSISVGFTPSHIAWVGIAKEHDHEGHDHD